MEDKAQCQQISQSKLCPKTTPPAPIYLEGKQVLIKVEARYLGIHLVSRLTWKPHIRKKTQEVKLRLRSLYWLLRANGLLLDNKRLLYITVLRPIWSYGAPVWGCTADSNLLIVQRLQNFILRKLTSAPWFIQTYLCTRISRCQQWRKWWENWPPSTNNASIAISSPWLSNFLKNRRSFVYAESCLLISSSNEPYSILYNST